MENERIEETKVLFICQRDTKVVAAAIVRVFVLCFRMICRRTKNKQLVINHALLLHYV